MQFQDQFQVDRNSTFDLHKMAFSTRCVLHPSTYRNAHVFPIKFINKITFHVVFMFIASRTHVQDISTAHADCMHSVETFAFSNGSPALRIGRALISFVYRDPRMQKFVTAARVCLLLTHATRFTIIYGQGFNKSTRIRSAHHNSCGIFNGSVAKFHRFRGQREIANKKKKSQQVLGRSNRSRECVRAACMPSR